MNIPNQNMPAQAYAGSAFGMQSTKPEPALSAVTGTLAEAGKLAQRVSELVDRLLGPVPAKEVQGALPPKAAGSLQEIRDNCGRTSRDIREAMRALDRLATEI